MITLHSNTRPPPYHSKRSFQHASGSKTISLLIIKFDLIDILLTPSISELSIGPGRSPIWLLRFLKPRLRSSVGYSSAGNSSSISDKSWWAIGKGFSILFFTVSLAVAALFLGVFYGIPWVFDHSIGDSSPIIFHFVITRLQVSLQSNRELCLEYEFGSLGLIFVLWMLCKI